MLFSCDASMKLLGRLMSRLQWLKRNLSFYVSLFRWGWRRDLNVSLVTRRTKGQAFQVLANPNVWINPQAFHMYNARYIWFDYGQRSCRYVIDDQSVEWLMLVQSLCLDIFLVHLDITANHLSEEHTGIR